jgi:hypothetical protein
LRISAVVSGSTYTGCGPSREIDSPLQAGTLSSIAGAVWGHSTKTLTSFGSLVADTWGYGTRTVTDYGSLVADSSTAVWSETTRTLTSFGSLISGVWGHVARTLTDIGFDAADIGGIKAKTDNLPGSPAATGAAMTLTTGERSAIASTVLVTPENKILTNGSGHVTSTNGGGGGGGGEVTGFSTPALDQLRGIEFIGPASLSATPRTIVAGDDYMGSRAFLFESEALPDCSTASSITFSLRATDTARTLRITTPAVFSDSPRKITVAIPASMTRIPPGHHLADVEAVIGGLKQTIVGPGVRFEVVEDQTR